MIRLRFAFLAIRQSRWTRRHGFLACHLRRFDQLDQQGIALLAPPIAHRLHIALVRQWCMPLGCHRWCHLGRGYPVGTRLQTQHGGRRKDGSQSQGTERGASGCRKWEGVHKRA